MSAYCTFDKVYEDVTLLQCWSSRKYLSVLFDVSHILNQLNFSDQSLKSKLRLLPLNSIPAPFSNSSLFYFVYFFLFPVSLFKYVSE